MLLLHVFLLLSFRTIFSVSFPHLLLSSRIQLAVDTSGANTIWYLQFHFECVKLLLSVILTNLPCVFLLWLADRFYYTTGGLLASKDFLFHQLSWWFIFAKGYKEKSPPKSRTFGWSCQIDLQRCAHSTKMQLDKSRQRRVCNPQLVAVWNQHEVLNVINPKEDTR